MKITNIDSFIVGAGWWPWTFVKVETDEGVTGWGECALVDIKAKTAISPPL